MKSPTTLCHQLAQKGLPTFKISTHIAIQYNWSYHGARWLIVRELHLKKKFHYNARKNVWLRVLKRSGIKFLVLYLTGVRATEIDILVSSNYQSDSEDINTDIPHPELVTKMRLQGYSRKRIRELLNENQIRPKGDKNS